MSGELVAGLCCPTCGTRKSTVVDTRGRYDGDYNWRRRQCENGHRYTTHETVVESRKSAERMGGKVHREARAREVASRLMEYAP